MLRLSLILLLAMPVVLSAQNIVVSPNSLVFNAAIGGAAPNPQNVTVSSPLGVITWIASTSTGNASDWIVLGSSSGDTTKPLKVSVDISGLPAGSYSGTITVVPQFAGGSAQKVSVTLNVASATSLTVSSKALSFAASPGGTAPAAQVVTVGSTGPPLPFNISVATTTGGPWLSASANSTSTPANLSVGVNPAGLALGTYSGTVTLNPASALSTSSQAINVTLTIASPVPNITAVVNSASYQNTAIAPGEIVTIAGTNLGPATPAGLALDQSGKVSTNVAGVQAFFGGFAAPLIYVSATQINAVVPYEIQGLVNPQVQVKFQGQTSNGFTLVPASTSPALFTANSSGSGPVAALNQDLSYNTPTTPAPKGSYITIYVTGEGQTAPAGVTGKVTSVSATGPLTPQPLLPVAVLIGGQPANISFYGEAPTYVSGVMQVNVQIPPNSASGALAILVSVGGNSTQGGVTVQVQ